MTTRIARLTPWLLLTVLAVAGILRVWSIDFGLPYAYHIDERSYVIGALNLGQGEITGYPQQTGLVNLLLAEFGVYYLAGRALGTYASVQDFARGYYSDPSVFYLLGRLTSAILGVIGCGATYLLGKELRNRFMGLAAALLLAVNFLHVRESHFTTPDVAQGLGFTVVLLLCLRALKTSRTRYLFAASLLGGVVIAWKWASAPLVLPLLFVAWRMGSDTSFRIIFQRWVACGLLALAGFALFSPQLLLFPAPYIAWARLDYIESSVGGYGGFLIDTVPGWLFYAKALWIGAGGLAAVLALGGLLLWTYKLVWQRDDHVAVLLLLLGGYFLLMASSKRYFVRYAIPMMPFLALAAADFIDWVCERALPTWGPRLNYALVTLVLLATVQPALAAVRLNILWTREDTRTIAKNWIEANIPEGAKIATDWMVHGVPLSTQEVPSPNSSRTYQVREANGLGLSDRPLEAYRAEGQNYIVTTSYISHLDLVHADEDQQRDLFYASLPDRTQLVQTFSPSPVTSTVPFIFDEIYGPIISLWQRERPGPTLRIYEIDRPGSQVSITEQQQP